MSSSIGPAGGACLFHLGEGFVCLERPGFPDERRACEVGEAAYAAAVRELASHCDAPVTAVLPSGAFAVAATGRGRLARLRARRLVAQALGASRSQVLVAAGRVDGGTCMIGVSRDVVEDTVRFLGAFGIEAAALRPEAALLAGAQVPVFPVGARGGLAAREPVRHPTRLVARGGRLAAVAVSAAALVFLVAGPGGREEPAGARLAVPAAVQVSVAETGSDAGPASGAAEPILAAAPTVQAAAPSLGAARPLDRPHLAPPRAEPPRMRLPDALPPAAAERPAVVLASRSVPPEVREAALAAAARSASLRPGDRGRLAMLGPRPRPTAIDAQASPMPADAAVAGRRPLPRPAGATEQAAVEAVGADSRPLPRPGGSALRLAEAVEVAVAAAAAAGDVAAEAPGAQTGSRPEPRSFAATAVRVAPPLRAGPATPVEVARAVPLPSSAPVAQAQPVRQAPMPQTVSRGSGSVVLIGVFGTSSRRHALVRLPNGSIERVRPGDAVNGVQIAAVGQDSVRVRVNGRDGVLRLPD